MCPWEELAPDGTDSQKKQSLGHCVNVYISHEHLLSLIHNVFNFGKNRNGYII